MPLHIEEGRTNMMRLIAAFYGRRSMQRRSVLALLAALAVAQLPGPAFAQAAYPNRPITMIVPFAAGGPTDLTARIIA